MQCCILLALNTKTSVEFFLNEPVIRLIKWIEQVTEVLEKIKKETQK